jgi:tetratricopeptide (TPR) repeat protein
MLNINHKPTKIIILVMVVLVGIGLTIAKVYYGNKNKTEDPRVKQARVLYGKYNEYAQEKDYQHVLDLLDSIETIYQATGHYSQSYEMGVLHNNRGAVYLTIALHEHDSGKTRNHYLDIAEKYFKQSIDIYESWMDTFGNLDNNTMMKKIKQDFPSDAPAFRGFDVQKIRENRLEDMMLAQTETPRRLSVSYTNIGIIHRHHYRFKEAMDMYEKALALWDRNHTAKNNLNILLGKPVEKPNVLERLFPPEKEK